MRRQTRNERPAGSGGWPWSCHKQDRHQKNACLHTYTTHYVFFPNKNTTELNRASKQATEPTHQPNHTTHTQHRFTLADPLWETRPGLAAATPAVAAAPDEALKPPGGRRRRLRWMQEDGEGGGRRRVQEGVQEQGGGGVGLTYMSATGKYSESRFINATLGNYVPQVCVCG